MRPLVFLLVLLTGCASSPDPYPVEPQSVTVHFLSKSEWRDFTTQRTLNGSWGMPGEIKGTASIERDDDGEITECDVFFPAGDPPSRHILSHEMRHCTEGAFHR